MRRTRNPSDHPIPSVRAVEETAQRLQQEDIRRQLRVEADRVGSIKALAKQIGVSREYLSAAIAGRRPIPRKALVFLNIRVEYVGGTAISRG